MNYNNFTQETSRMLELMKYGINESASKNNAPRVEYSVKAADGLTYGIVNEGTKFYIKVAPKKDTEILSEDFDYIGGAMNKKLNEYKSYASASKDLELKLMQINESHKDTKVAIETSKKEPAADWQINETVEMRAAINRMNQISHNVAVILEDKNIVAYGEDVGKVKPCWTCCDEKPDAYTEEPVGKTHIAKDEDWTDDDQKPSKKVEKTNDEVGSSHASDTANGFTEKPKMPDTLKENKSKRVIKLTEEQVLAWNRSVSPDYTDKSNGTEIGSSAPFEDELDGKTSNQGEAPTEPIHEAEGPVHNSDTTLYPNGGTGDVAHDGDPFEKGEGSKDEAENGVIAEDVDDDEVAGFEGFEDDEDPVPFHEVEVEDGLYDTTFGDEGEYDEYDEPLYEVELHDFGQHPAYRKKPMTLPANKEVAPNGYRDWNDESAEGEEPFGKKIGSSAPFEKAVQKITNSIMESLGF